MRTEATLPIRGRGARWMAAAAMAAFFTACASGGGAPPVTGAEAEALFAELSGVWVLNEENSTPPTKSWSGTTGEHVTRSFTVVRGSGRPPRTMDMDDLSPPPTVIPVEHIEAAVGIMWRRPDTLELKLDAFGVGYYPSLGPVVYVPMDGHSEYRTAKGQTVRTRIAWQEGTLGIEHSVGSRALVREVLEVVDGRLEVRRTMQIVRNFPPVVLRYDRSL